MAESERHAEEVEAEDGEAREVEGFSVQLSPDLLHALISSGAERSEAGEAEDIAAADEKAGAVEKDKDRLSPTAAAAAAAEEDLPAEQREGADDRELHKLGSMVEKFEEKYRPPADAPVGRCQHERRSIVECYRRNGVDASRCAPAVDALTRCAIASAAAAAAAAAASTDRGAAAAPTNDGQR